MWTNGLMSKTLLLSTTHNSCMYTNSYSNDYRLKALSSAYQVLNPMPKLMATQTPFYKNWQSKQGAKRSMSQSQAIRKLQRQVAQNIPEEISYHHSFCCKGQVRVLR